MINSEEFICIFLSVCVCGVEERERENIQRAKERPPNMSYRERHNE